MNTKLVNNNNKMLHYRIIAVSWQWIKQEMSTSHVKKNCLFRQTVTIKKKLHVKKCSLITYSCSVQFIACLY